MQQALIAAGLNVAVVETLEPASTAKQAAETLGCTVAEIAKTIVFRGKTTGNPVLVVASGAHRIDERKLERILSESVVKPDAAYVREVTGYAIGGIPPLGHTRTLATIMDDALMQFARVYAAGGTPNAMFAVSPRDLLRATAARLADVRAPTSDI